MPPRNSVVSREPRESVTTVTPAGDGLCCSEGDGRSRHHEHRDVRQFVQRTSNRRSQRAASPGRSRRDCRCVVDRVFARALNSEPRTTRDPRLCGASISADARHEILIVREVAATQRQMVTGRSHLEVPSCRPSRPTPGRQGLEMLAQGNYLPGPMELASPRSYRRPGCGSTGR